MKKEKPNVDEMLNDVDTLYVDALKEHPYFQKIYSEPLKNFVLECIDKLGKTYTIDTLEYCGHAIQLFTSYLVDGGKYNESNPTSWYDVLIAATFIHYFTYDEKNPVTSLYLVRNYLANVNPEDHDYHECPFTLLVALCDTLECAAGCRTKVLKCQPVPNSPQQVWSDAIWTEKYLRTAIDGTWQ